MAGQRIEAQRDIIAEAPDVWVVLTDIDRYPKVLRSVDAIERLEGSAFDVGLRWREVKHVLGRVENREFVVTLVDPGRRIVMESRGDEVHYRTELTLHPSGVGTRLRAEVVAEAAEQGALQRFTSLFGGASAKANRRTLDEDLEDLGRAIEHRVGR